MTVLSPGSSKGKGQWELRGRSVRVQTVCGQMSAVEARPLRPRRGADGVLLARALQRLQTGVFRFLQNARPGSCHRGVLPVGRGAEPEPQTWRLSKLIDERRFDLSVGGDVGQDKGG